MAALLSLFRHATHIATATTDRELLGRFAGKRDEEAFAELVHRHGPVVYRICNRLVGADAAEDAFQAVFLVLATRVEAARAAPSVAGWLVGVAGRVARQMRRAERRRTHHETAAAEARPTEWADQTSDFTDQFRILDEELAHLPEYLRDPVVLCLLQGRTQDEAAAELGRDARTLRRRLERAKHVLRARLERRGVVPAVAAALVAGAGSVSATAPHALALRTVAIVFDFLTGGTVAASSTPVVLAKGVATTMLVRKLMSLTVAAAVGLVGLGVVLAGDGPPAAPPAPMAAPALLAPLPPQAVQPTAPKPPLMPTGPALELDWKKDEARMQALLGAMEVEATHQPQESKTRSILIQAMCVRVPRGFCERSGLTDEESSNTWFLSQRERRMFSALLSAEPGKEIVGRPQINLQDGQTGFCQVGQELPVVTGQIAEKKDGKITHKPQVSFIAAGITLRVTPKIGKSGQLLLRIEAQSTEVGAPVQIVSDPADGQATNKRPETFPSFNSQSIQTTVIVPDAGTVVIRSGSVGHEVLWILTPHVIRAEKKAAAPAPPAPKPVPVAPAPAALKPLPAVPPGADDGTFSLLNSTEYQVPVLPGNKTFLVPFVDSGTVEKTVEIKNYRVSAGGGLRIAVPALGPLPMALDYPVPVGGGSDDRKQLFNFYVDMFGDPK